MFGRKRALNALERMNFIAEIVRNCAGMSAAFLVKITSFDTMDVLTILHKLENDRVIKSEFGPADPCGVSERRYTYIEGLPDPIPQLAPKEHSSF